MKNIQNKSKFVCISKLYPVILLGVFLLGFCFWYVWKKTIDEDCKGSYSWLNPSLNCGDETVINKAGYVAFKTKLIDEIETLKNSGQTEQVSIYFRDLENGPSFGIDDREKFIPASLLKVPVMLTYLKIAENEPGLLAMKLIYKDAGEADDRPQTIDPNKTIEPNKPYSIDELIFRMVAYSDNMSYGLLYEYLKEQSSEVDLVTETYNELGMINPGDDLESVNLTVKTYATIFRMLYNASYLSNELSEIALGYLASSDFANGLRKGVPQDIPIAHKFGERKLDTGKTQLHDCGIVYYPQNPYLLCVFTSGVNFQNLSGIIGKLSQLVWDEVESRRI